MKQASFYFWGELNDFLTAGNKGREFPYAFEDHQSVKHLIEALGIPHPEVHHILANGRPVGFDYQIQDGEQVEVYPASGGPGETPPQAVLQPALPGEPRFILDSHLGKLAHSLRMLGFDSLYRNDFEDKELAAISARESRTLLTRDRR
ncbi:MAG TPA: Mut7-C RNAse domain-containing protein, partial [Anaerolineales bacterium]